MIIETKKIYKTDDGRTFNTEKEALAYEAKVKEERRKKAESDKKLSDLEKEWRKKLDKAVEAYNDYAHSYDVYADEYRKHYKKEPTLLDDEIIKLLDLLF